jgi:multiple sugar transport system permease protein
MTLLVLVLSSTAGYAMARIPFKGRSVVYALVMVGLVIPDQAVFIPLYTQFADWNLHNV